MTLTAQVATFIGAAVVFVVWFLFMLYTMLGPTGFSDFWRQFK